MDVLVVVGTEPAPARLEDRALHVHRFAPTKPWPRSSARCGPASPAASACAGPWPRRRPVAAGLRRAGLPTELFTDEPVPDDSARAR